MSFTSRHRVRFADCDPAGIAYFPRLLALLDAAIEDWTLAATGVSRGDMHRVHGFGLPTGSLQTRFAAPARLEEQLDIRVRLRRVGHSSIGLDAEARCGGAPRFSAALDQVLIQLSDGRPRPWPPAWRARLDASLEAAA